MTLEMTSKLDRASSQPKTRQAAKQTASSEPKKKMKRAKRKSKKTARDDDSFKLPKLDISLQGIFQVTKSLLPQLNKDRLVEQMTQLSETVRNLSREDILSTLQPLARAIRRYHKHKVIGLENIPADGPCLIVVNHSLATYDIVLLFEEIYSKTHRLVRPLVDRLFFKIPYVGEFVARCGAIEGTPQDAVNLLKQNEIVAVAPGGMREALRPSSEKYQIMWNDRRGFARVAIEAQAPVILAACPQADDLYHVSSSFITEWFYEKFKIPVFMVTGVAITPIPKPVKLVHYCSKPIVPPKKSDQKKVYDERLAEFHQQLCHEMKALMNRALQHKD